MRSKLQKFTNFTNTLLPHETAYLLSVEQFKDEKRLEILQRVDYNARNINQFTPYDTSIDKRKYNHLQNWIQTRLEAVDVDVHFNWILDLERKIMTDSIELEEEKTLLKAIRGYEHPGFFFTRFYELVGHYRHFLLIRLRYEDHQLTQEFLAKHKRAYKKSKETHERLHDATTDIVKQYSGQEAESSQWEEWLTQVFYDEELDGINRYLALVRLTFIGYNYRKYDLLREKFDYLDRQFSQGQYYSKRLLLNYYNSRLMLHSHYREYDKAVYYGYLSVRSINHDYPLYVNNLCAVLLRIKRNQEALQLMKKASTEVKKTNNMHNRIGFVAFYMEALIKNGLYRNAESYGDTFLKAYSKEVLQFRWHLFFSIYLEAMLHQKHYAKMARVAQKYQLLKLDKDYQSKNANYIPNIPLYIAAARHAEGLLTRKEFIQQLESSVEAFGKTTAYRNFLEEYKKLVPEASGLSPEVFSS